MRRGFTRIRQHRELWMLPFVILLWRKFDFRLSSICPMHRDAIVSQSELRESFRVAAYFRAFCPGIAIAVQTNAAHSYEPATANECLGPVRFLPLGNLREQVTALWCGFENLGNVSPK